MKRKTNKAETWYEDGHSIITKGKNDVTYNKQVKGRSYEEKDAWIRICTRKVAQERSISYLLWWVLWTVPRSCDGWGIAAACRSSQRCSPPPCHTLGRCSAHGKHHLTLPSLPGGNRSVGRKGRWFVGSVEKWEGGLCGNVKKWDGAL